MELFTSTKRLSSDDTQNKVKRVLHTSRQQHGYNLLQQVERTVRFSEGLLLVVNGCLPFSLSIVVYSSLGRNRCRQC